MSRKWARMVDRNTKMVNQQRKKQGKPNISLSSRDEFDRFLGRRWVFPLFLIAIALLFAVVYAEVYSGWSYWFITISYVLLAMLSFFSRRPYIGIGTKRLATRKFSGDKYLDAEDIGQITLQNGFIIVEFKNKRQRWVFSKLINLYPIQEARERIKQFAQQNNVKLVDETV